VEYEVVELCFGGHRHKIPILLLIALPSNDKKTNIGLQLLEQYCSLYLGRAWTAEGRIWAPPRDIQPTAAPHNATRLCAGWSRPPIRSSWTISCKGQGRTGGSHEIIDHSQKDLVIGDGATAPPRDIQHTAAPHHVTRLCAGWPQPSISSTVQGRT